MPPSPRQHHSPSGSDSTNARPSWKTSWKLDLESGKRKLVVTPRVSGRTPDPTPQSAPQALQDPRGNLPEKSYEQRTPGHRDTETPDRTIPAPPFVNFFDWSLTPALPQRSLSLVCGALPNAKRRVWLPSYRCSTRPKIHFLSSGSPGVRVSQFIHDPARSRILDNYSKVCTIQRQYGITTVKVIISWPGYDDFKHTINLRQVLCMGDLLHELCRIISKFRHQVSTITCKDPLWILGPRNIAFEDIWITSFGYSHCGYWAPVLEVEV